MTKTRKTRANTLTEELLEIIRVKPEQTAKVLSQLNYTIHPRPNEVLNKIPRGKIWCCYCGDWKKFGKSKKSDLFDYDRCETCNISVEDYYEKLHNGLWQK